MESTEKGIAYPSSTDNIAPLESHFAALAQTADNAGVISGREQFVGPSATGSTVGVNVEFDYPLAAVPQVALTVQAGAAASSYIATIVSTDETGFAAKVYRLNGSGADSNLFLHWIASDYQ